LRECLGRTTSEVAVLAQSGVQLRVMNTAAKGAMQGMENIRTSLLPRTQLLTATIFGQVAVGDATNLQKQAVRTAEGLATLGNTLTHDLITGAARFQSGEADIRSAQSAVTTLNGIQAALKEGVTIVGQNHAALEAARAELSEALAKTQEGLQNYDAAVAAVQSGKNTPALAGPARK
jgi:homoserine dehydrogenase